MRGESCPWMEEAMEGDLSIGVGSGSKQDQCDGAVEARERALSSLERQLEVRREEEELARLSREAWYGALVDGFRPRGNYLLVEMVVKEQTSGGILLPDAKRELPGHGVVRAVGLDALVSLGDHVFFSRFCGCTLQFPDGSEDMRYRVISEDEIYGTWPKLVVGGGGGSSPSAASEK